MKIIDFHTHFFPYELAPKAIKHITETSPGTHNHTDGTLKGLQRSMQESSVDLSVTLGVATKPSHVQSINKQSVALQRYDSIIPFGALHPQFENFAQEIDYLVENGIKGIKLHPEFQYFHIDDRSLYPMYEQLSGADLVVVFHTGKDPGPFTCDHALPEAVKRVHTDFPKLKMVAAHMGGWKVWDRVEEVLCAEEIWFDTSAVNNYMDKDDFLRICKKHGTDRIVFGSDTPWYDQAQSVKWIESSGLSDSELEKIFYKNSSGLLCI